MIPFLAMLSAQAAEVTDLPPGLRGDVELGYRYDRLHDFLYEDDAELGSMTSEEHVVTYGGTFAPYDGIAVWFELPQYASERIAFHDTYFMAFDPNVDSGTMVDSDPDPSPPTVKGTGLGGLWVGLEGTPFSQTLFPKRPDRLTMLLHVGYRFPDKSNFFTTNDADHRGAGPGGAAWRVRAAFSTTHRSTEPYLVVTYERDGNIKEDIRDESGATLARDVDLNPADNIDARVGAEILAFENEASGAKVSVDFFANVGYWTWQDVPSGIYLPSVVPPSYGQVVTQSETAYGRAGIGLNWRMFEYLEWDIAGDAGTHTAHRLEHPYAVTTGIDSFDFSVYTMVRIRLRDAKPGLSTVTPS